MKKLKISKKANSLGALLAIVSVLGIYVVASQTTILKQKDVNEQLKINTEADALISHSFTWAISDWANNGFSSADNGHIWYCNVPSPPDLDLESSPSLYYNLEDTLSEFITNMREKHPNYLITYPNISYTLGWNASSLTEDKSIVINVSNFIVGLNETDKIQKKDISSDYIFNNTHGLMYSLLYKWVSEDAINITESIEEDIFSKNCQAVTMRCACDSRLGIENFNTTKIKNNMYFEESDVIEIINESLEPLINNTSGVNCTYRIDNLEILNTNITNWTVSDSGFYINTSPDNISTFLFREYDSDDIKLWNSSVKTSDCPTIDDNSSLWSNFSNSTTSSPVRPNVTGMRYYTNYGVDPTGLPTCLNANATRTDHEVLFGSLAIRKKIAFEVTVICSDPNVSVERTFGLENLKSEIKLKTSLVQDCSLLNFSDVESNLSLRGDTTEFLCPDAGSSPGPGGCDDDCNKSCPDCKVCMFNSTGDMYCDGNASEEDKPCGTVCAVCEDDGTCTKPDSEGKRCTTSNSYSYSDCLGCDGINTGEDACILNPPGVQGDHCSDKACATCSGNNTARIASYNDDPCTNPVTSNRSCNNYSLSYSKRRCMECSTSMVGACVSDPDENGNDCGTCKVCYNGNCSGYAANGTNDSSCSSCEMCGMTGSCVADPRKNGTKDSCPACKMCGMTGSCVADPSQAGNTSGCPACEMCGTGGNCVPDPGENGVDCGTCKVCDSGTCSGSAAYGTTDDCGSCKMCGTSGSCVADSDQDGDDCEPPSNGCFFECDSGECDTSNIGDSCAPSSYPCLLGTCQSIAPFDYDSACVLPSDLYCCADHVCNESTSADGGGCCLYEGEFVVCKDCEGST